MKDKEKQLDLISRWGKMERFFDSEQYTNSSPEDKEKFYWMGRDLSREIANGDQGKDQDAQSI